MSNDPRFIKKWNNLINEELEVKDYISKIDSDSKYWSLKDRLVKVYKDLLYRKIRDVRPVLEDMGVIPNSGSYAWKKYKKPSCLLGAMSTNLELYFKRRRSLSRYNLWKKRNALLNFISGDGSVDKLVLTDSEKDKIQQAINLLQEVHNDWNKETALLLQEIDFKL